MEKHKKTTFVVLRGGNFYFCTKYNLYLWELTSFVWIKNIEKDAQREFIAGQVTIWKHGS